MNTQEIITRLKAILWAVEGDRYTQEAILQLIKDLKERR